MFNKQLSLHTGLCVCVPILVTTFPEWLSGTKPLPHTPGAVLVVFVVFYVNMHSFAGLIRRTPPPTFSDTAITDRYSDTTIFQLRATHRSIQVAKVTIPEILFVKGVLTGKLWLLLNEHIKLNVATMGSQDFYIYI